MQYMFDLQVYLVHLKVKHKESLKLKKKKHKFLSTLMITSYGGYYEQVMQFLNTYKLQHAWSTG